MSGVVEDMRVLPFTANTYVMVFFMWLVFTPYVLLWAWNVNSYLNVDTDLGLGPDSPNAIGTMEVTDKKTYGSRTGTSYRCFGEFTPWDGRPTIEVAARQLDEDLCVKGDVITGGILVPDETTSQDTPFVYFGDGEHPPVPQVIGSILLLVLLYYPVLFVEVGLKVVRADVTEGIRSGRWRWPEKSRIRARSLRRARHRAKLRKEARLRYARRREEERRERAERAEREEQERRERARQEEERALGKEVDEVMIRIHEETDRQMEEWRRAQGNGGPEGRD